MRTLRHTTVITILKCVIKKKKVFKHYNRLMNEFLRFHILRHPPAVLVHLEQKLWECALHVTSSMGKENEVCVSDIQKTDMYVLRECRPPFCRLPLNPLHLRHIRHQFQSELMQRLSLGCSVSIRPVVWRREARISTHARSISRLNSL